ncbi:MAG: ATP-dependent Clp protease ATP-binding subunit, partial [Oscillospiraceae bacterium]|nr:ATP-dependent Clp protease ATP-binding subunit [Oscillospiraceae bacterium]
MEPVICARCKKNVAVIFITKIEAGQTKNEGLCLKCARELHIKPVDDIISRMGLSDEDLESLQGDVSSFMNEGLAALQGLAQEGPDEDDGEDEGKTATFPFLNRLMGQSGRDGNESLAPADNASQQRNEPPHAANGKEGRSAKKKFLDNYCINLTDRARQGKLDSMIGRQEELERVIQILNRRQKNNPCLIGEPG